MSLLGMDMEIERHRQSITTLPFFNGVRDLMAMRNPTTEIWSIEEPNSIE
jgi:hypothetical protein